MKKIIWIGSALKDLQDCPEGVKMKQDYTEGSENIFKEWRGIFQLG